LNGQISYQESENAQTKNSSQGLEDSIWVNQNQGRSVLVVNQMKAMISNKLDS